jgi:hypothetical protein
LIELYVDRQNDLCSEISACNSALEDALGDKGISINGNLISLFDNTRPMLCNFLAAAKRELERQIHDMPLVVRISTEEQEDDDD